MIKFREYQEELIQKGLAILKEHDMVYYALEMRLGKTLISLETADRFLAESSSWGKVLFITKKKAIPSIEADYLTLDPDYDLTVINYESLHKVERFLYDVVIIDEAHSLGAFPRPSKRTGVVKNYVGNSPVIYLSGTPTPESYSQLYHQMWVSSNSPWRKYPNFYKWAKVYVNVYERWIAGSPKRMYEKAHKKMIDRDTAHLFVSMSQEEAGFNQSIEEKVIYLPMPEGLREVYNAIDKDGVYIGDEWAVACVNAADKINKLSQICGGTLITEDGTRYLDQNKGLDIDMRFPKERLAIIYKYQGERAILEDVFMGEWTDVPEEFESGTHRIFLGQVQSVREGVDLKSADAIVMYNIDFSATSYYQARARLQSRNREKPAIVYWIFFQNGIEDYVYKAVQAKKNFTGTYYRKIRKKEAIDAE